ncbi:filamentous hemagglutinin N-terminal domain-containing protein [Massilia sp. W12]|uniref:two-partner secretion domain-containing protein n=1 Tax=Massilia sp. W12 TaxID=3126507 RepID=UPI0030D5D19C
MNTYLRCIPRPLPYVLAILLGSTALLPLQTLQANPQNPQVVAGSANINSQGNVMTIVNSNGTIINWQSFSINPNELTRFVQPGPNSSVLNRVQGQDPSRILGALQSNGKVFLINQNGILFGQNAKVDVHGLVASTLNISDQDFLNGRRKFEGAANAGKIEHHGVINTPSGGQVFLLAPNVSNHGLIQSPQGEVVLAAGHSIQLVDAQNPALQVNISAPENAAINLGQMISQGGRIGIYGALVNQRGVVNADSAVLGENGKVVLKASRDTLLEAGSLTSATSVQGKGGEIQILGRRVAANGNAKVDASGATGGGTILFGGDYQGKNQAVQNAEYAFLGKQSSLRADAASQGDGGRIIVWSDRYTQAYGEISAQGAQGASTLAGTGGFVETSGKQKLDFRAKVNTKGGKGKGTVLLDPAIIQIAAGTADGGSDGNDVFNGGSGDGVVNGDDTGPSVVYQSELQGLSAGSNILLEAGDYIHTSGNFASPLTLTPNTNITLRTRNLSGDSNSGQLGIDLTTASNGAGFELLTQGTGTINLHASGPAGYDAVIRTGKLTSAGGAITLAAKGDIDLQGNINSNNGNLALGGLNIALGNGVALNSGDGHMSLEAKSNNGEISFGTGASLNANGPNNNASLELRSDKLSLGATGAINYSGLGSVRIKPWDSNRNVAIRDTRGGAELELSAAEINRISAPTLILNSDGVQTVDAAVTLSNVDGLQMLGGSVQVNQPLTMGRNHASVVLGAGGAINLASTGSVSTNGANAQIVFNADALSINGAPGAVNAGSGVVRIIPKGVNTAMQVGVAAVSTAGQMGISEDDLKKIHTTGGIALGGKALGWNGSLGVTLGGLDLTGGGFAGALRLESGVGGDVYLQGPLKAPQNLRIEADNIINATSTSSINAGNILLKADRMNLVGAPNSISAGSGAILINPRQTGWKINLGATMGVDSAANTMELAQEEIASLSAAKLRLGSALNETQSGDIQVVGPVSTTIPTLILASGGEIAQGPSNTISASNLLAIARDNIDLGAANNVEQIAGIAGDNSHQNRNFTFRSTHNLDVGTVEGISGINVQHDGNAYDGQNPNGVISLRSDGTLMQSNLGFLTGKALYAEAKCVVLPEDNAVMAVAGKALGTDSTDIFAYKTLTGLRVSTVNGWHGISYAGPANVANAIQLRSPVSVGQDNDASITGAGALKVESGNSVHLNANNQVGAFLAQANGNVQMQNSGGELQIGADGAGISSGNGDVTISNSGGLLKVKHNINAGAGQISLSGPNLQLGSSSGGVQLSGNNIDLIADSVGGQISTAGTTSQIGSSSSDSVTLKADAVNFSAARPTFTAHPSTGTVKWRSKTANANQVLNANSAADWVAGIVAFGEGSTEASPTGNLTVASALTVPAKLGLFAGGSISQSAPITAQTLLAMAGSQDASGSITLNESNQIGAIIGRTQGGDFSLRNFSPLTTGSVVMGMSTVAGIATNNGAINIDNTGAITINHPIDSGTGPINIIARSPLTVNSSINAGGNISLEAGASGSVSDKLIVTAQGSVNSSAGSLLLRAGDSIVINGAISASGPVTQQPNQNPAPQPSLNDCIANPSLPGCSVVLPSLSTCISNPATPGCSVVLPRLADCIATPTTPGCSVVLPTLATCIATPSAPGCTAVLPSLASCVAAPSTPGCSVVLPNIATCTAAPTTPGCSAILPSLTACISNPAQAGCSVVLPRLADCIATPTTPGCSVVLPTLATCIATPSAPGCTAVLPSLASCIAAPSTPGCGVVLPSIATCTAAPATPGCSAVLPSLTSCINNPAQVGCSAVLPRLADCIASPTTPGCSVVLPSLASCIAAPATPGCSAVLPSLTQCLIQPSTPGCAVVLPTIAQCVERPSTPGCSALLPTLARCIQDPATPGCVAVLPRFADCVDSPTTPGCSVILPNLATCIAAPSTAGCLAVLPRLAVCIAAPATPGCSVVLPNLATCISAPGTPGCSAILPSLNSCINNPAQAGCSAVLPSLADCRADSTRPGCVVVLPPSQSGSGSGSSSPVVNAVESTVQIINTSTVNTTSPMEAPTVFASQLQVRRPSSAPAAAPATDNTAASNSGSSANTGNSGSGSSNNSGNNSGNAASSESRQSDSRPAEAPASEKKEEAKKDEGKKEEPKKEDDKSANKDSGAKKDEPARKLYCN